MKFRKFQRRKLSAQDDVKLFRFLFWVWVFVALFMLFAVSQQKAEVEACWGELEAYRVAYGSLPDGVCYGASGFVGCEVDVFLSNDSLVFEDG